MRTMKTLAMTLFAATMLLGVAACESTDDGYYTTDTTYQQDTTYQPAEPMYNSRQTK